MNTNGWCWRLHRMAVDKLGWFQAFSKNSEGKRMLFLSENDEICHTQVFPFFYHSKHLGFEIRELPLAQFKKGINPYIGNHVDVICLQTWFDLDTPALHALVNNIKFIWPDAKTAYFDWFAPTDLRYAEALNEYVTVYVKKHILKDLDQYGKPTLGDTNLTDFFAKRYGIKYPETCYPVPEDFFDKLWLGPHFVFSSHILPQFLNGFPYRKDRSIDLHARIAVNGSEWYSAMRQETLNKAALWQDKISVACLGRVSRTKFWQELYNSKLCFSPFGYGEFCWRDFEAMLSGSLLLKPDMSHLAYSPEAFIPHETYIPLAWDLSDFDEKVNYYLNRPKEREAITMNAFKLMAEYFQNKQFLKDVTPFLERVALGV